MKTMQELAAKPYFKCFICPEFRNTCGGMPTRDMTIREWCEYIRDIKEYFHLTNAYITEKAESSQKTTERIMANTSDQDIMRSTTRRYEMAVIGATGKFTCFLDYDHTAADQLAALQAEVAALKEEVAYWRKENDRKAKVIDKLIDN